MPVGGLDSEKLFRKFLNFSLKDPECNNLRKYRLLLTVEWKPLTTTLQKKELFICLADDNDPFFLYMLTIDNEDFVRLKHQQGLLVDFPAFPQSFIDLLESCLQEESRPTPRHVLNLSIEPKVSGSSNYASSNYATLDVVEINRFKIITHLSLKLSSPDDELAKQYLTKCFKNIKEEKETLAHKLSCLESDFMLQLGNYQGTLKTQSEELEHLKEEMRSELSAKDRNHNDILKQEKRKYEELQIEETKKHERELRERETRLRKEMQELQKQVAYSEAKNNELKDKNVELEHKYEELQNQIRKTEREMRDVKKHLESCKQQNREIVPELEKMKSKLEMAKSDSEFWQKESASKENAITELHRDLTTVIEEKSYLEETLSQKQESLEKCYHMQKTLSSDIKIANNIIQKMQAEAKLLQEKRKTASMLVVQLQQDLKAKENHVAHLEKELISYKGMLKEKKDEVHYLTNSISDLQKKLEETERRAAEKEDVHQDKEPAHEDLVITSQAMAKGDISTSGNQKSQSNQCDQGLDPRYLHKNHNLPKTYQVAEDDASFIESVYGKSPVQTVASAKSKSSKATLEQTTKSGKVPKTTSKPIAGTVCKRPFQKRTATKLAAKSTVPNP